MNGKDRTDWKAIAILLLLAWGLAFLASAVVIVCAAFADHGLVYYADGEHETVAARYSMGITGLDVGGCDRIKALDSAFRWYVYNSATDNYIGSDEDWMLSEDCYLHYSERTIVRLWGQEITCEAGERVVVYYPDGSRRACNFSTPATQAAHLEAILALELGRPFDGTSLYADGIFLDNCGYLLNNHGTVLSGGIVAECGHVVGSREFQAWHWAQNLGPFCVALRESLHARGKGLVINCSGVWSDDLVGAADYYFQEYSYSPVRNNISPAIIYEADLACHEDGGALWYDPNAFTSRPPYEGEISVADAMMGNLAWYLLTRGPESVLYLDPGVDSPNLAGWDSLTWRGIVDSLVLLGEPEGAPSILLSGIDPRGQPFDVWGREYANGLVLLRVRDWNQHFDAATAVTVVLPESLRVLDIGGVAGDPTNLCTMRNASGIIAVRDAAEPDTMDPGLIDSPLDEWMEETRRYFEWLEGRIG